MKPYVVGDKNNDIFVPETQGLCSKQHCATSHLEP